MPTGLSCHKQHTSRENPDPPSRHRGHSATIYQTLLPTTQLAGKSLKQGRKFFLALLLALLLDGLGLALHALWIAALILFGRRLVGSVVARGSGGQARGYCW